MNQLYVGIDVGSAKNAAYLMMPDGSKHSSFSVQNNLGGAKLLTAKIVSVLTERGLPSVTIGMEATSVYGDTLVYALREDGRLGRFERKIHVLNPKPAYGHVFMATSPYRFQNAFVARMKAGDRSHTGIFERTDEMTSNDRVKLKEIMGLSVPQMLGGEDVEHRLADESVETFNNRLDHEVWRILNGFV